MRTLVLIVVAYCAAMRVFELWRSRRNARRMLACGARRVGQDGTLALILVHTGWFVLLVTEESVIGPQVPLALRWVCGVGALLAEALRIWCKVALGEFFNVRVIVLDGTPLVTHGPYRFLKHPNYLAAALVVVLTPLALGLLWTAVLVLPAKLIALRVRLAVENAALAEVEA